MCRCVILVAAVLACSLLNRAQTSAANAVRSQSSHVVGHGAFPVKLTSALESSKLKTGDMVELEIAQSFKLKDGTLVPKGSKLEGHVIRTQARSRGDADSTLALRFDKIHSTGGRQLGIKGAVQAIFPPADEVDPGRTNGLLEKAPAFSGEPEIGSNLDSLRKPQPVVGPDSVGVQGIHDLSLNNGVITSKGKQVKLGRGVRMIVRVEIVG
jgi:hypothetical protein